MLDPLEKNTKICKKSVQTRITEKKCVRFIKKFMRFTKKKCVRDLQKKCVIDLQEKLLNLHTKDRNLPQTLGEAITRLESTEEKRQQHKLNINLKNTNPFIF